MTLMGYFSLGVISVSLSSFKHVCKSVEGETRPLTTLGLRMFSYPIKMLKVILKGSKSWPQKLIMGAASMYYHSLAIFSPSIRKKCFPTSKPDFKLI